MDPMMLMGLLQMGMGGMQSATNTALGAVPMGISILDRVRARTDPLMRQIGGIIADRYNQSVTENLYGDPYGAWGGMFGTHPDGTPVAVGEAAARATAGMLGANPAVPTIENYAQLSQMHRPEVQNTAAGLQNLTGHPVTGSGYQQPNIQLQTPNLAPGTQTDFSGSPAPRDTSSQTVDPKLASGGVLSRVRALMPEVSADGGGYPMLPGGGGGGNVLPAILQAAQGYQGGYGTGGLLRHAAAGMFPRLGALPSFAVGTPYVPQDMVAKVHQGEAIIPADQNPWGNNNAWGKTGLTNDLVTNNTLTNNANMSDQVNYGYGAQQQSLGNNLLDANARAQSAWNVGPAGGQGGGVSHGMAGSAPAPGATSPHSLLQDVIGNPVALSPEIIHSIITQGTDQLQNNYAGLQRQAINSAASLGGIGGNPNLSDQRFNMFGDISKLTANTNIAAAQTNWQNLLQSAGLQLQGENALTQANQWQQAFEQGLYGQDMANYANIINAMNAAGQQGLGTQQGLWQNLLGLGNQGVNFQSPFLSSLLNLAQWRISPGSVSAGPTQVSGTPVPFYSGGGSYGGGYGSSGQSWDQLAGALGYWAGQGFQGMA